MVRFPWTGSPGRAPLVWLCWSGSTGVIALLGPVVVQPWSCYGPLWLHWSGRAGFGPVGDPTPAASLTSASGAVMREENISPRSTC